MAALILKGGKNLICSYCESENSELESDCYFCKAALRTVRPSLDKEVIEDDYEKPYPILATYHTYHLLLLLKKVRAERTSSYHLMRSVQKGLELIKIDSEILRFGESEYRRYTARMKVIEGILIDRMGYKPKRVDDKLLDSFQRKLENA
ncbi:hypothetical protein [Priestia megaterium]|uniref:hypothetical protein n=1 Tax=Priestia megaterium TaxID=1404 RepID=UPI001FB2E982|nr:hypothetical protein [Priestia megaterium]